MYFVKVSGRGGKDRTVIASIPIELPGHVFSYLLSVAYMVLKRVTYCIPWLQWKLLCVSESVSLARRLSPISMPRAQESGGRKELLQGINRSSAPIHHLRPPAVFDEDVGLSAGSGVDQAEFRWVTEKGGGGGGVISHSRTCTQSLPQTCPVSGGMSCPLSTSPNAWS